MATKQDDARGSAIKVLDVLDALSAYAVNVVSNTSLSQQLNLNASAVTRPCSVFNRCGAQLTHSSESGRSGAS